MRTSLKIPDSVYPTEMVVNRFAWVVCRVSRGSAPTEPRSAASGDDDHFVVEDGIDVDHAKAALDRDPRFSS